MAYNQGKNPFSKSPLNFNSPLNSFDSLVGKLMNQGKSKEAATKIAGKVANAKMKGAGSGPTAAQKARSKGSAAKMADESPLDKELVGKQHNLPEHLKAKIEAAPESPAKMKSPIKAHDKKLKALEKRIKRVRQSKEGSEGQGGIDYELLSQLEEQKKKLVEDHAKQAKETKDSPAKMKDEKSGKSHGEMNKKEAHNHRMVHHVAKHPRHKDKKRKPSRPEASKRVADQLNAKDPIKGSPGSPANLKELGKGKKGTGKMKEMGKGKRGPRIPNPGEDGQGGFHNRPKGRKPKKDPKKDGLTKVRKADSPANLKGVIKGAAKAVKKAKIKENAASAIKQGKAAIKKLGKTAIKALKKKSPLNNAYENPEYFVPTKSSYGQDMDNFFGTVNQAYDDRKRYGKGLKGMKGDPFSDSY